MRCIACDAVLSDYEATRKSAVTGEYYDLCNKCFDPISKDTLAIDRPDLIEYEDVVDEEEQE